VRRGGLTRCALRRERCACSHAHARSDQWSLRRSSDRAINRGSLHVACFHPMACKIQAVKYRMEPGLPPLALGVQRDWLNPSTRCCGSAT